MKFLTILFLINFAVLFASKSVAQQLSSSDCLHPKNINLTKENKLFLDEDIYYQEDDFYSFWYKITSTESITINYEIVSLSEGDVYELFIYRYNGTNFCNDLVAKKIKHTKSNLKGSLILNKNEPLYISVLHLSGKGCGHNLILSNAKLNYTFNAIQNTCVEEFADKIEVIETINDSIKNTKQPILVEQPILKQDVTHQPETPTLEKLFKGIVINSDSKQPIDAEVVITTIENNTKNIILSSKNEGFETSLTTYNSLIINIEKLGYKSYIDTINNFKIIHTIPLQPLQVGEKIVMHKIYFHPNTAILKENSKKELEKLLSFIIENENYAIEIQGHTNGNRKIKKDKKYSHLGEDWNFSGSAKELSQLRAEKIKTFLKENGANDKNIIAKGYGGDKMIIENPKNMKEAMKNIRVEIVVIEQIIKQ